MTDPDIFTCPRCKGPADNGFSRGLPPEPYVCTKCEESGSIYDFGGDEMTNDYEAAKEALGQGHMLMWLNENVVCLDGTMDRKHYETIRRALTIAAAVERGEYVKLADAPKDDAQPDAKWLIERQGVGEYSVTKYAPATDGLVLPPLPEGRGLFYRMITNQFDCNGGDWFICMIGQSSPEGANTVPYSGEGDTIRAAALDALSKMEGSSDDAI